jgi:hypothetical protein
MTNYIKKSKNLLIDVSSRWHRKKPVSCLAAAFIIFDDNVLDKLP